MNNRSKVDPPSTQSVNAELLQNHLNDCEKNISLQKKSLNSHSKHNSVISKSCKFCSNSLRNSSEVSRNLFPGLLASLESSNNRLKNSSNFSRNFKSEKCYSDRFVQNLLIRKIKKDCDLKHKPQLLLKISESTRQSASQQNEWLSHFMINRNDQDGLRLGLESVVRSKTKNKDFVDGIIDNNKRKAM
ncbi:hypothetical protein SSS_03362 [Sarcoptes scabiei]|uniref:Uncharacterized protein n=1 Tax=Sarcoptes scabiei TaxID=52283 RepID=A0A834RCE0_SARSC|nr:hypothetical protein SSS_03362 [Sarcoptes scabiei]UXI22490.1 PR domain zinc finger protein 1 [Sarcoptes scabiei]